MLTAYKVPKQVSREHRSSENIEGLDKGIQMVFVNQSFIIIRSHPPPLVTNHRNQVTIKGCKPCIYAYVMVKGQAR